VSCSALGPLVRLLATGSCLPGRLLRPSETPDFYPVSAPHIDREITDFYPFSPHENAKFLRFLPVSSQASGWVVGGPEQYRRRSASTPLERSFLDSKVWQYKRTVQLWSLIWLPLQHVQHGSKRETRIRYLDYLLSFFCASYRRFMPPRETRERWIRAWPY
jgi:hypothetical protein